MTQSRGFRIPSTSIPLSYDRCKMMPEMSIPKSIFLMMYFNNQLHNDILLTNIVFFKSEITYDSDVFQSFSRADIITSGNPVVIDDVVHKKGITRSGSGSRGPRRTPPENGNGIRADIIIRSS